MQQKLESERAALEKDTAEANARQKEAELKLAQLGTLVGPRLINFDKGAYNGGSPRATRASAKRSKYRTPSRDCVRVSCG
jgi:hypothetical protein